MIVVTIELWSARSGRKTTLGRMQISNDGVASTENPNIGDYIGRVLTKPRFTRTTREAKVYNHRRHDLPIWSLVAKMLNTMGYGR